MKKFLSLVTFVLMSIVGATAQTTLIDYPISSKDGVSISGTTVEGTVKINSNTNSKACLTLKNGYVTDNAFNGNAIILKTKGGFKAGDVLTIAGAINNSDEAKRGTAVLFTVDAENKATAVKKFDDFINGRLSEADPINQSYTLEADMDSIMLGRDGNTGVNLTYINVVRPAAEPEPVAEGPIVLWENGETSTLDGYTYITIPASQLKDFAKAKDTIRVSFAIANVEARQATPARNVRTGEISLWFGVDEIKTISEINKDTKSVDFILKAADVEKLAAAESVSLKYKYLTVAKVEFVSAVAVPEPEPVDLTGKLVIGKVFYAGSIRLNGATPKNYLKHLYIELFNNSAETIDVAGTYIALANSDSPANAWTTTAMAESHPDSAVVKQIFQIPATSPVELEAGKSIVIANCAIDHSEIAEGNVNLSTADFEVKSTNNAYNDHNENVPALTLVKTVGTTDFINMLNPGPNGIVLLPANTDLASCPETYAKGKTTGNLYTIVPLANSIDCVDIVKQKTPSADDKRFAEAYDAGFTCTLDINTYNCQAVARKVLSAEIDGRKVLQDTNNSSNDFETLSIVAPRIYGEGIAVGITNVSSQKVADVEIYNLQGVRMSQLQKGINIVNGKKVVIK
ncbi:MAG: DUF4876 domain-containing protein [Prevotella sp.]|nr:DUF4876 domain-containing protein [Prevotella sp.]